MNQILERATLNQVDEMYRQGSISEEEQLNTSELGIMAPISHKQY